MRLLTGAANVVEQCLGACPEGVTEAQLVAEAQRRVTAGTACPQLAALVRQVIRSGLEERELVLVEGGRIRRAS